MAELSMAMLRAISGASSLLSLPASKAAWFQSLIQSAWAGIGTPDRRKTPAAMARRRADRKRDMEVNYFPSKQPNNQLLL
jgi:hypothetical protein